MIRGLLAVAACLLATLAATFFPTASTRGGGRLVVHEWGTFTSLEDESGAPIRGINTDDEPLPDFVHNLRPMIGGPSEVPSIYFKSVARSHPDVLVRLETPVIYFHLPANGPKSIKLDLDVTFHGGWLTQYYPDAQVSAPGLQTADWNGPYGKIDSSTNGTLAWHGLTIGPARTGPSTKAPVWLAPRAVAAADVTTAKNESERFLFYRGVGNLIPPVQVSRSTDGATLRIHADTPAAMRSLRLVDVKPDGRCALRMLNGPNTDGGDHLLTTATFAAADYAFGNVALIRKSLSDALMHEGLFADEAEGLLNTWETSYFRRPGLRLFFVVPSDWTNRVLPLHLSNDAEVNRVMIGRIEIITPEQRALLSAIARGPASNPEKWLNVAMKKALDGPESAYRDALYASVIAGQATLQSAHVEMPDDYRAYLQLGRFRNALILDEQRRRPAPALATFVKNYELESDTRQVPR